MAIVDQVLVAFILGTCAGATFITVGIYFTVWLGGKLK